MASDNVLPNVASERWLLEMIMYVRTMAEEKLRCRDASRVSPQEL